MEAHQAIYLRVILNGIHLWQDQKVFEIYNFLARKQENVSVLIMKSMRSRPDYLGLSFKTKLLA